MIKAVLFDLDNTLNNRVATVQRYANVFLADFQQYLISGLELQTIKDRINSCDEGGYVGRLVRCERLLDSDIWLIKPTLNELLNHWLNWVPKNPIPMPALEKTLSILKDMGLELGIITNGSLSSQKSKIDTLGIAGFFTKISISEEIGIKKPNPEIFLETLKAMSIAPEEAIFVGDHPLNDIQAAIYVKMTPVWIAGFHQWPVSICKPKYIIKKLSEVIGVVTTINKLN